MDFGMTMQSPIVNPCVAGMLSSTSTVEHFLSSSSLVYLKTCNLDMAFTLCKDCLHFYELSTLNNESRSSESKSNMEPR